MKKLCMVTAAILLTALAAVAQTGGKRTNDEAAIRRLAQRYANAWNRGDAKGAAAIFAADAVFITMEGAPQKGRTQIQKGLAQDFAGPAKGSRFQVQVTSVRFPQPNFAIAHGTTQVTGGQFPPGVGKGHYLAVFGKTRGEWRVLAVHVAAVPPPSSAGASTR